MAMDQNKMYGLFSFNKRNGVEIDHLLSGKVSKLKLDREKYILVEHRFVAKFKFCITWSYLQMSYA